MPALPDTAPASDTAAATDAEAATTGVPALGRTRRMLLLTGALLLLAGGGLVWFAATTPLLITLAKVLLGAVGSAGVLIGLGRLGHGLRGRPVDTIFGMAMTWLVLIVGLAALAPVLPLGNASDSVAGLSNPIFAPPGGIGAEHPLGTNSYGLDVFARAVEGARTSLAVSLGAILIGSVVGGLTGMIAGFFGGVTDRLTNVLANALLAVPPLILLIAIGSVLDPSLRNIAIALSLLTIPSMVRLARANTIAFAQRDFVLAARSLGASRSRLLFRELLPNVALPVVSLSVVLISVLIVAEASLSFLGLGIQAPEPTWGNMVAEGQGGVMQQHPHIVVVPGVCLFLTVFAFNLMGEKAQKRWDPRSAQL